MNRGRTGRNPTSDDTDGEIRAFGNGHNLKHMRAPYRLQDVLADYLHFLWKAQVGRGEGDVQKNAAAGNLAEVSGLSGLIGRRGTPPVRNLSSSGSRREDHKNRDH